jgi:hypothetical protein
VVDLRAPLGRVIDPTRVAEALERTRLVLLSKVAENEANRCRASTTLSEFYARDLLHSFATIVLGQVQQPPSASRGRGGRGQGGRIPSGNAQGRRAQQGSGASRPRLIPEPALGSESLALPSALHIHLWLDHVETFPRGSASSK